MIYLDTMNITDQAVLLFAEKWKKVKPTLLYGHAHSLYILAVYVKRLGINSIKPRGILSTSMMLIPHERQSIEDAFGIKVTDRYGCEEVSLIASECEKHEGMHLNIEHLFIEFIKEDGTSAGPGEMGSIIITDLMNRAMPFIRYQVEDMGVPSDRRCSCGRGLPLMDRVIGRTADFLIRRDGSRVAGVSLIENTLTKIPGIDQMQIIQTSFDELVLNVVADRDYREASDKSLNNYFKKLFGDDCNIMINLVKEIKPESSGKYRFSICNIK
jgi:phenylacetate-CoA ligase